MPIISLNAQSSKASIRDVVSGKVVGVTIGNFDGIHIGHQKLFSSLFEKTEQLAKKQNTTAINVLVSFYPHPKIVLKNIRPEIQKQDSSYWSITPLRAKSEIAKRRGFNYFYPIRFRKNIAVMTPEQFVKQYLCDVLNIQVAVVGYDWSFGKNKIGTPETLTELGQRYGFETVVVPRVMQEDVRVSSSEVKKAIQNSEFKKLKNYLARDYSICGKVVAGEKRGRTIGFPTANIIPEKQLLPPKGVYATELTVEGAKFASITNVGVKPTFADGGNRLTVETHILDDVSPVLYGKHIEVSFFERIRDEKKFSSVGELKKQITADCHKARKLIKTNPD